MTPITEKQIAALTEIMAGQAHLAEVKADFKTYYAPSGCDISVWAVDSCFREFTEELHQGDITLEQWRTEARPRCIGETTGLAYEADLKARKTTGTLLLAVVDRQASEIFSDTRKSWDLVLLAADEHGNQMRSVIKSLQALKISHAMSIDDPALDERVDWEAEGLPLPWKKVPWNSISE